MEDGVWRTVGGRRIFIKKGQSLQSAMKDSGKFGKGTKEEKYSSDKKITNDKEYETTVNALNSLAKQYNESNDEEYKEKLEKAMKDYQKNLNEYDKSKGRYNTKEEKIKVEGYKHKIDADYEERLQKYKEIQKDANKRYDKGEIDREERNKLIDDAHDKYIKQKTKIDTNIKDKVNPMYIKNNEGKVEKLDMNEVDRIEDAGNVYDIKFKNGSGTISKDKVVSAGGKESKPQVFMRDDEGNEIKPSKEFKQLQGGVTVRQNEDGSLNYIQGVRKGDGSHEYTRTDYNKYGDETGSKTYKSLEEAKAGKRTETGTNDWVKKAFAQYKKDHPKTKLTINDFKKQQK